MSIMKFIPAALVYVSTKFDKYSKIPRSYKLQKTCYYMFINVMNILCDETIFPRFPVQWDSQYWWERL